MSIFNKLRGKTSGKLPWKFPTRIPTDLDQFLTLFRDGLPAVFRSLSGQGRDPVIMLVDLEDARWQAIIGFIITNHGQFYFSPEAVIDEKPRSYMGSDGPYYHVPTIDGKQANIGVYAVERDDLVSALCAIRGLPLMFLKQVQKAKSPGNMFTVVYFMKTNLGVKHVSGDATIFKAPNLSIADLM